MRQTRSLRARVVLMLLLVVSLSNFGLAISVNLINDEVESLILNSLVATELKQFIAKMEQNPAAVPPRTATIRSYQFTQAEHWPIPYHVAALEPGNYHDVEVDDQSYHFVVSDVGDDRLFVGFEMSYLKSRGQWLSLLLFGGAGATSLIALWIGLWLSRTVVAPVSGLARDVSGLDPGERGVRLEPRYATFEVGSIARAFDRYMRRLDGFVEREQSFTAAASHELRTPLSVIQTSAELLDRDPTLGPGSRKLNERVLRGVRQMSEIINALLALARERTRGSRVGTGSTRLEPLIRELVGDLQYLIADKPIRVVITADRSEIEASEEIHACIVLSNLLRNAFMYTERGQVSVTISRHVVTIQDTGVGIAAERLAHVFDSGYKGDDSEGLGLGLHIVKYVCDHNGWSLDLSSRLGSGTRTIVRLSGGIG